MGFRKPKYTFTDADSIVEFIIQRSSMEHFVQKMNLSPLRAKMLIDNPETMLLSEVETISELMKEQRIIIDPCTLVSKYLMGFSAMTIRDLMKICNSQDLVIRNSVKSFKVIIKKDKKFVID